MNHTGVLLLLIVLLHSLGALAQNTNEEDEVDPHFSMMTKEVGATCGPFLPYKITGITEQMSLCGARAGFKIGEDTTLEPQILAGAGHAQRYLLGTVNFRGDAALGDFTGSYFGGLSVHQATRPLYHFFGLPTTEQTNTYFGMDIGGAFWWMFTDLWGFRGDFQFNISPGFSVYVGVGLVLRFDPQNQGTTQAGKRKAKLPWNLALEP